jgi:chemotaxis protein MotB
MKKSMPFLTILVISIGVLLSACVSNKKFTASEANVVRLRKQNDTSLARLLTADKLVKVLSEENAALLSGYSGARSDLRTLSAESELTIADQAKRLKTLQDISQAQKDVMNKIKNSISEALNNYPADELSVYIKNGNVYVSLEEKLLFKSGSDQVGTKGKEALKSLARVLNSTKDITVMIEGHTDNVPIKTSQFQDNWDLSTARATSVVRILTNEYGFDPRRITASGRGNFHPILTNETASGRAGNRRTVVSLTPDLTELYQLLE